MHFAMDIIRRMHRRPWLVTLLMAAAAVAVPLAQKPPAPKPAPKPSAAALKLDALKQEAIADVESRGQFSQQMVDQIFSYGELGFQEFETNRYLIDILKKNGFAVEEGIAGIPTSFMATWGSGKPVIALGSDIDCIPQASQKPGVAARRRITSARGSSRTSTSRCSRTSATNWTSRGVRATAPVSCPSSTRSWGRRLTRPAARGAGEAP